MVSQADYLTSRKAGPVIREELTGLFTWEERHRRLAARRSAADHIVGDRQPPDHRRQDRGRRPGGMGDLRGHIGCGQLRLLFQHRRLQLGEPVVADAPCRHRGADPAHGAVGMGGIPPGSVAAVFWPLPVTGVLTRLARRSGTSGPAAQRSRPRRVSTSGSSICSLRTSALTCSSPATDSVASRTRSTGTVSLVTTGRSAFSWTSCSASVMSAPDRAASRLAPVTGSRSSRTSSWLTGTVVLTFSVTTYLRSRARPTGTLSVPTFSRSSERVIAPSVSWPWGPPPGPASAWRPA